MAAARASKGLNMNRPESGNRARVARYRAKHRRIEFFPSADVLKIIELHKAQGMDNCLAGVIDQLIRTAHRAISGNGNRG